MRRRNFVKTLVAPVFILPLRRSGDRGAGEGFLYLISDHPERYIPLLLDEMRPLGFGKTKAPRFRTATLRQSRLPSFTATLNGRVIDVRRPALTSLWQRMQCEDPSRRLTIVVWGGTKISAGQGAEIVVKVEGNVVDKLPLRHNATRAYAVKGGRIAIEVADGAARVMSSGCAQKICLSSAPISTVGERIICAPHRFIMEIPGLGVWDSTTG